MNFGIEIKDNPRTFQEKLIWLQFYGKSNWLKPKCSDKLGLHEYALEMVGKDICVPVIREYESLADILLDELPNEFILKTNHGSGQFVICKDKKGFDLEGAKKKLASWLSMPYGVKSCEPHYLYIKRRCYAETLLKNRNCDPVDNYKLFCFNGKPKLIQMECDLRTPNERFHFYDMDLKLTDICRTDHPSKPHLAKFDVLPTRLDLMKSYAEKLAAPFKFVRVDFYEVNGEVYLGEMTFVPGAAKLNFKNPNVSIQLGDMLKL